MLAKINPPIYVGSALTFLLCWSLDGISWHHPGVGSPYFFSLCCHTQIVLAGVVVFPLHPAVVTNILSSAFARHRTVGLPADLTVASWWCWFNILLLCSSILTGDLTCHVRNSPVRDLNRVGVDNGGKNIIFGEVTNNLEELSSNVCCNIFAEGRVKIDAISGPGSVLLGVAGINLIVSQLVAVTSFLQGLLIRRNCSLKNILIAGELA